MFLLAVMSVSFAEVTDLSAENAAAKLKKKPEIIIVDVRTAKEYKEGHIKGAINIDVKAEGFEEKLGKLDRKKTYLMHCRSGGRSGASLPIWERLGFKNVLHLNSGILGWKKAGLELVKTAAQKSAE